MASHLRIYRAPEDLDPTEEYLGETPKEHPGPTINVRLGDLLPLVAMAQKLNFIWLKDFLDDEVTITEDLHQVLQSFRSVRPSAS